MSIITPSKSLHLTNEIMDIVFNRIFATILIMSLFFSCSSNEIKKSTKDKTQFKSEFNIKVGQVLVATSELEDPNFGKSVILILANKNGGVSGVKLNGNTIGKLSDVNDEFSNCNLPLKNGGPVGKENIIFLHHLGDQAKGALKIKDGIYLNGDISGLLDDLNDNKLTTDQIIFYKGLVGWKLDQLKKEVEVWKSWKIMDIDLRNILKSDNSDLWNRLKKY